jgi:toxin-antitoxin system PIN domain toxin
MLLPDVNVLLNALNQAAEHHESASRWLEATGRGSEPVGLPDLILSSVVRISTGSSMLGSQRRPEEAFQFCDAVRHMAPAVRLTEGPRHWDLFQGTVLAAGISGRRVSDAYLAAFALENDATFVTFDRGFQRFPSLRVLVPA